MDIVQAVVFMLIGIVTASLIYKVLSDMVSDIVEKKSYQSARRAILDDRQERLGKALKGGQKDELIK